MNENFERFLLFPEWKREKILTYAVEHGKTISIDRIPCRQPTYFFRKVENDWHYAKDGIYILIAEFDPREPEPIEVPWKQQFELDLSGKGPVIMQAIHKAQHNDAYRARYVQEMDKIKALCAEVAHLDSNTNPDEYQKLLQSLDDLKSHLLDDPT